MLGIIDRLGEGQEGYGGEAREEDEEEEGSCKTHFFVSFPLFCCGFIWSGLVWLLYFHYGFGIAWLVMGSA